MLSGRLALKFRPAHEQVDERGTDEGGEAQCNQVVVRPGSYVETYDDDQDSCQYEKAYYYPTFGCHDFTYDVSLDMTADFDNIKWQCRHVKADEVEAWGQVTIYTDKGLVVAEACEPCALSIYGKLLELPGGVDGIVKLKILDQPSL
jgi:hypothetical protein